MGSHVQVWVQSGHGSFSDVMPSSAVLGESMNLPVNLSRKDKDKTLCPSTFQELYYYPSPEKSVV